jgi:hypothetical protein
MQSTDNEGEHIGKKFIKRKDIVCTGEREACPARVAGEVTWSRSFNLSAPRFCPIYDN